MYRKIKVAAIMGIQTESRKAGVTVGRTEAMLNARRHFMAKAKQGGSTTVIGNHA